MHKNLFIKNSFVIAALVLLFTAIVNNGFMASDEYWTGITRYIPAQQSSLHTLIRADDVKSPLQLLPFYSVSQLALKLGVDHPYSQYQITRICLAIINTAVLLLAFALFASCAFASANISPALQQRGQALTFLLLAFFYPAAFIFTRPMFESMAAPWLTLAVVLAYRYDRNNQKSALLLGAISLSVAFCLRPQVGFSGLVLVLLPILKKRWADLRDVLILGGICFVLTGLPDLILRGQFHQSLLAVTIYNFKDGHLYGEDPWFYYLLMIPILWLLPFWGFLVSKTQWRESFHNRRSLWIALGLFVFLHSLFSQKFERFIIPVIPILILLLAGFIFEISKNFSTNIGWGRRTVFGLGILLNFTLFVPAAFWPAQQNIIDLALFLDAHPDYTKTHNINESYTWIPDRFIDSAKHPVGYAEIKHGDFSDLTEVSCQSLVVVNEPNRNRFISQLAQLNFVAMLDVNPIEKLAFKLNPEHNQRRSPLYLYSCKK